MVYLVSDTIYQTNPVGKLPKIGALMVVCLLLLFVLAGCERVEVVEAEFHPKYICTGETATFEWKTSNIDRIELIQRDGTVLKSSTSSSGTYTTPPINELMLPLKVKGYVGDTQRTEEVEFVLIDNPHWTMKYGTTIQDSRNEEQVLVAVEPSENPDGSITNIRQYEIYRTFTGFSLDIPHSDFSHRARVLKISRVSSVKDTNSMGEEYDMNTWPGDLFIEKSGTERTLLSHNAVYSVPLAFHPGGSYKLKYPQPERRLVATMSWPEGTGKEGQVIQPQNPDPYWNKRAAGLKFEVICD